MAVTHKTPFYSNHRPMCSFCGEEPATATWRGAGSEIHTCRQCAVEMLPALAADAIVEDEIHNHTLGLVNNARLRMDAAFHRACFLSALRSRRGA